MLHTLLFRWLCQTLTPARCLCAVYLTQPEADEDAAGTKTRLRMEWAANDLLLDRPPLSRWEAGHAEAFETFMKRGLSKL